jgi:hypothetical protein
MDGSNSVRLESLTYGKCGKKLVFDTLEPRPRVGQIPCAEFLPLNPPVERTG